VTKTKIEIDVQKFITPEIIQKDIFGTLRFMAKVIRAREKRMFSGAFNALTGKILLYGSGENIDEIKSIIIHETIHSVITRLEGAETSARLDHLYQFNSVTFVALRTLIDQVPLDRAIRGLFPSD